MAGSVPRIWKTGEGRSFVKSYALQVEDHLAARYGRTEALPFGRFAGFVVLVALFIGFIFAYPAWKSRDHLVFAAIVAGALVAGVFLAIISYRFFRGFFQGFWKGALEKQEAAFVPLEMTADARGIAFLIRQQTWFCPWDSLLSVEEDAERYFFWTSATQAHVLPKHLFEADERGAFDDAIRDWTGAAPVSPPRLAGQRRQTWGSSGEAGC